MNTLKWLTIFTLLLMSYHTKETTKRMKGVWVATVDGLDYPKQRSTNPEILKQQADTIISNAKAFGMNTIFFQVRPTADAFYKSSIFPWSIYLTGASQGTAPENDFDPLAYWIEQSHKNGLELHAWLNPYRITFTDEAFEALADTNPAKLHPEWVVQYSNQKYYFDPGVPATKDLIIDGAVEIVKNYDVDGIHIDDYFYPGKDFDDSKSFAQYGSEFENVDDFRWNNINKLIEGLNTRIHEANPNTKFGVSPAGIWANKASNPLGSDTKGHESYYNYYCDSYTWIKQNMIDYIIPQIYWSIGFEVADYSVLLDWWSEVAKDSKVELYIGMADYKAASTTSVQFPYGSEEIERQLELNNNNPVVKGEVHFSYKSIEECPELNEFYRNNY